MDDGQAEVAAEKRQLRERKPVRAELPGRLQAAGRFITRIGWGKVGLFIFSLFLFILAIDLMKIGARSLVPLLRNGFAVDNPLNGLGFGWLFAYVIMSGSPVAAAALTFLDAGAVSEATAFTMIMGSRFGASFIVLLIGFIYVLRGRNRATSLSMGLLALSVTTTTHLAGLLIGMPLLQTPVVQSMQFSGGALLTSVFDRAFGPITNLLGSFLPQWALFLVGLGVIILSFKLFDLSLPTMTLRQSQMGQLARLVFRPWVMFVVGGLITLISMSVSVSLTLLVPLSERGYIRRENIIPYMMGANITTFIDTLLAAVLLDNPAAFTIVFVEMLSVAVVSIVILALFYDGYNRAMLGLVEWVTASDRNLAIFMLTILVVPVVLMFL